MIRKYEEMVEIIDKAKYCYIGSIDDEGSPNIKAMTAPRKRDGIMTFYLPSQTLALRTAQFRGGSKACLYFNNVRTFKGLMLKGKMEVLEDRDTKEKFWVEEDAHLYPKGISDPNFCVLKFTAQWARFFDGDNTDEIEIK